MSCSIKSSQDKNKFRPFAQNSTDWKSGFMALVPTDNNGLKLPKEYCLMRYYTVECLPRVDLIGVCIQTSTQPAVPDTTYKKKILCNV